MKRVVSILVLAGVLLLAGAGPAVAAIGVGTDVASIEVTEPLAAGGTYELRRFAIINTGTESMGYGIMVSRSTKPGMPVPESWLKFQPSSFYLGPKRGANVVTTLRVSEDAQPGLYRTRLLGVPTLAGGGIGGGRLTVGVGPSLIFTVVQPSPWQWAYFRFMDLMPWSGMGVAALVAVSAALLWRASAGRRRSKPTLPVVDGTEDDGSDEPGSDGGYHEPEAAVRAADPDPRTE
jgi:hypothetical protein